jgi:hypothetical protein
MSYQHVRTRLFALRKRRQNGSTTGQAAIPIDTFYMSDQLILRRTTI